MREFIKVVIIVAIAVPFISLFAAWTGPTASPPNGNAEAPINVGPLDQIKSGGWLSLGNLISRSTTLLARDSGTVGIGLSGEGTEVPTESLDARGFVKGRTGLCIGDDCRASWPAGPPAGYQEFYYNLGEDIYSAWRSTGAGDNCNGNPDASYECKPEESRNCTDRDRDDMDSNDYRTVSCKIATILVSGEGLKKSTVGTAEITKRDYSGDSEKCFVKIESPGCDWAGESANSSDWSDSRCEFWVEGTVAGLCFPGKGFYAIWDRFGDSGPIEIFYRP